MYIMDGIVYAGSQKPSPRVSGVRPLAGNRLWVRFTTGEAKIFDFTPLLDSPAFAPLKDPEIFNSVYIDYGLPTWNDGEIDIDPLYLYQNSVAAGENAAGA